MFALVRFDGFAPVSPLSLAFSRVKWYDETDEKEVFI